MLSKEQIIAIKQVLTREGITSAKLFGSYARGSQMSSSDIDIVIEVPSSSFSLFDLSRVERLLEESLGRKVDLVTYNSLHPKIKSSMLKDEVSIL